MSNKLVRNEQRKLTASFLNGVAIAMFGIGGFAPVAALAQSGTVSLTVAIFIFGCLFGSVGLHSLARNHLGGLEE